MNKNGGIYVKNLHRKFPVEFRYYDDESSKDRVQQLYVRLINQDKADFLVSPYSSGLTASSAIIAEQYEKVMLATGAASDSIFFQRILPCFSDLYSRQSLSNRCIGFAQNNRSQGKKNSHYL